MPIRLSDLRKTADAAIDADGLDSAQVSTIAQAAGLSYLSTLDSLPTAGLTSGDQAFVQANQRLYISNGTGWYNVSLINLTPQFDSDINSTFSIVDSQTPLIISNPASDSDNPDAIITYGGTLSDSGQYLIALTRDSSVWTFTPLSADSVHSNVTLGNIPDSAGGDFTYTFTATDGINTATKAITITYSGLAAAAYSPMGSNHGYTSGGYGVNNPGPYVYLNIINRYASASDGNATDVGDLTGARGSLSVGQSDTVAVVAAGRTAPSATYTNQIQSYAFASSSNASDTGHDTPTSWPAAASQSYGIGNGTKTYFMYQDKSYSYDFASNAAAAATISPTTDTNSWGGEASSDTNGYLAGWRYYAGSVFAQNNTILRFPFAADTSTVDVGDLNIAKSHAAGQNSSTHGYASGGEGPPFPSPSKVNTIYKFAFASDGNSSDVGNILPAAGAGLAGGSSTVSGYIAGGEPLRNDIQKFPFASDGNTTDVGDLTGVRMEVGGHSN